MRSEGSKLTIDIKINGLSQIIRLREELDQLRKLGVKKKVINLIAAQAVDFKECKQHTELDKCC